MGFSQMGFSPENGLRDPGYITTPTSEEAAREQIQGRLDEIRDYINDELLTALENITSLYSGAERIGSASIDNVVGNTIYAQISSLKIQIADIVAGSVDDGAITTAKLNDNAVTNVKMADNTIGAAKIMDGAVTAAKLSSAAIDTANIIDNAVTTAKILDAAITTDKILNSTVTEGKLASNVVTASKIASYAVTNSKVATDAVSASKILNGAVTAYKIASSAVTEAKIGDGAVTTDKLGRVTRIDFGNNDYIRYDDVDNKYYLIVDDSEEVQLAPVVYGTSATPPLGTYPPGTLYLTHEA